MPASKRPRKKYKRIVIVTERKPLPVIYGLSADCQRELRLPYHISLDVMKRGAGNDDEAHLIYTTLLTAAALSKKFSAEVQADVLAAVDAIKAVKARGDASGKWGLSGDQFRAISKGLVSFDDMQDAATRRDVRDALAAVWGAVGAVRKAA